MLSVRIGVNMAIPSNLPQKAYIQGLWHMDEASGNALDVSDNGNDLVETAGTIASAAGQIGTSRDLELGDTEYFVITDAAQTGLDITGNLTICAWIRPESSVSDRYILSKYQASGDLRCYNLFLDSGNEIYFRISNNGTTLTTENSSGTVSDGAWSHIAAVYNGTKMQTFIAGVASGAGTAYSSGIADKASPFTIGRIPSGGYFDGRIDEVIIWNTALTDAEVLAVKNISAYSYGNPEFLLNMMR